MALDLTDCQFTGPALPEPFVKFELDSELTKLKLLPKTTGTEGKQFKEDWDAYRRHLAQLAVRGGPLRVRNHAIEPLRKRLGYTGEIESAPDVETREGREDGGYLLTADGAKLRVWTTDLDEDLDAPAKRGQAYRFSHLRIAQRVLLASGERVGLLTNGVELRLLISDPARPDSQVIFSLDPVWKRSRDIPDSFRLFLALVSPDGVKAIPDLVDKARLQQARVTKDLRDQARKAIGRFVQEVLDHPDNREWLEEQRSNGERGKGSRGESEPVARGSALSSSPPLPFSPADRARALWHEGLIIVYRLLFILKLESSDDPARSFSFASTSLWRNTFSPSMALARYARKVLDEGADTGGLLEHGLRGLFRMFHQGVECTELNVKPLGGALFGADATPVLSNLRWGERAVAHLLDQLLWTTPKRKGGTRERVHYGPLDVEDLGRVYEALLELEPGIAGEPMCRLRRQKLEVVVPIAQGEKYRPRDEGREARGENGLAQALVPGDEPDDHDEEDEVEEDEDDAPPRGKKTTVQWIEEIPPGKFYLRVGLGRKATGSYYTPHSFVRFLVQETLGPQVAERSPQDDPQPGEILKLKVLDPAMGSGHFLVEACRFLGQHLYEVTRLCDEYATQAEKALPSPAGGRGAGGEGGAKSSGPSRGPHPNPLPKGEGTYRGRTATEWRQRVIDLPDPDDELLRYLPSRSVEGEQTGVSQRRAEALCRRMVAVHCLYGVDKNPLAVELAKLALWLESHAEGMPLTFLDHRLVVGDSLTGPFWEKLMMRPSSPKEPIEGIFHQGLTLALQKRLAEALSCVRHLEATVGISLAEVQEKERMKAELDQALRPFRVIAAAWSGGVMLGPKKCDDLAFGELLASVAKTGEMPECIESERLQAMIARGLGADWSAGVSPAEIVSPGVPPAETTGPRIASKENREEAGETPALPAKGWHYRGYLPHFDGGEEVIQFVTFRLADSFPAARLDAWKQELKLLAPGKANEEIRRRTEEYLDAGHGECLLRDPRIASLVQNALRFFDEKRYDLHAWVVMPNHVHVLFRARAGQPLSDIVQSWKSYTAKEANKILGRSGQLWQEDYFDRYIRDEDHYLAEIAYIEDNPVKAGLCKCKEDWPFGSAGGSAGILPASDRRSDVLPASSTPAASSPVASTRSAVNAGGTPALHRDALYALLDSGRCVPALSFDLTFPEVFYPKGVPYQRHGFDAVVGNPPWDAIQFKSKEFFAAFDFEILNAPTKRERTAIEKRLTADPKCGPLFEWYKEDFEQQKRVNDCLYQYQKVFIDGDLAGRQLDAFRVFMERNSQLLRSSGITGVVVPSAFHANEGATGVRRLYLEKMALRSCYSFENRRKLFEIHSSFKFALVVAAAGVTTGEFSCAFYLHDDQWLFGDRNGDKGLRYSTDFVKNASRYLALLEVRTRRSSEVLAVIHSQSTPTSEFLAKRHVVFFTAEMHMSHDAWRFAELQSVVPSADSFTQPVLSALWAKNCLPLYEGKSFFQYDVSLPGGARYAIPLDQLNDRPLWLEALRHYRLCYRNISSSTNERTMVAALLPPLSVTSEKAPSEKPSIERPSHLALSLVSILNSFPFDYSIRPRIASTINLFILMSTNLPTVGSLSSRFLSHSSLCLTCNHSGYGPLWREQVGEAWREPGKLPPGARASCPPDVPCPQDVAETARSAGVSPAVDGAGAAETAALRPQDTVGTEASTAVERDANTAAETAALRPTWPVLAGDDERWEVRAAIDAVVADAYGLSRDQYAHVLSTFSHKSYPRAPELCLARFDELKQIGLDVFTRKYDPYWDIPLNENLPQPVIDLPIPGEEQAKVDGTFQLTGTSKPRKGRGRRS